MGETSNLRDRPQEVRRHDAAKTAWREHGNGSAFSWSLITRHFRAHEQLQAKIRQKIEKLEQHLQHFPRDAVRLHVAIEKNPHKDLFSAALVLRVPSNILHSEKRAPDPVPALDQTVKILLRQVAGLKSELRREALWNRQTPRAELRAGDALRFAAAPMPAARGPQNESDVLRALIEHNCGRLLRYVRRHVWHEARLGKIPARAIDPPVVVDEVARQALAAPGKKPADVDFRVWLYMLARQELTRRFKALQIQAREVVPLEETSILADDGAAAPDEAMEQKELLEQFQKTASQWPKPEREAFELYFVEGYEAEEIGMVLGLPAKDARDCLAAIHRRLRQTLLAQSAI